MRSSSLPLPFYPNIEVVHEAKKRVRWSKWSLVKLLKAMGTRKLYFDAQWSSRTTYVYVELGIQIFQVFRVDSRGFRVDSFVDRDEFGLKTLQGVDSDVFELTPLLKMSFKESCESTRDEPEIHMSPDF
ncbi:hypothetical protein PIB30_094320 [Stylosanthes scabra]|uniref:Uncharacterized protein n=1 Tax=Stylosanthes scabra TaxID=79078 RepID=A0ABU6RVP1_9FABA|nr:hypothetical protein [Stylosanthes scabra]